VVCAHESGLVQVSGERTTGQMDLPSPGCSYNRVSLPITPVCISSSSSSFLASPSPSHLPPSPPSTQGVRRALYLTLPPLPSPQVFDACTGSRLHSLEGNGPSRFVTAMATYRHDDGEPGIRG
jgi:hypothetical protein